MHDCASTNNVALRTLKVVYPTVVDVGCISHTLDLVGEKFTTPHLNEFFTWWVYSQSQGSSALEGANRPANAWIFSYQVVEQMGANKASNGAVWGC